MLYINPDECVDCGKCQPACPNDAVVSEYKLLDGDAVFLEAATELFEENPDASGGAEDVGKLGIDHPTISSWPDGGSR